MPVPARPEAGGRAIMVSELADQADPCVRMNRVASATKRTTFRASPSRWDRSCRATVASSHLFELTMASKTCLYWSRSAELRDFRSRKRGRYGLYQLGPRGRRRRNW